MSEKSTEIFISYIIEPPEFDADIDELEKNYDLGIYESSKHEIINNCGNKEFKYVWISLKNDIKNTSIKQQRIFAEQMLDKIYEIYDFTFPDNILLNTQTDLNNFYKFIEFLEYDNYIFLSYIWKFLDISNIFKIDIEVYCNNNKNKIVKEIDEQTTIINLLSLIRLFLRSFYKDNLIKWFIKNSKQNLYDINIISQFDNILI
jgi:hypothetical protein